MNELFDREKERKELLEVMEQNPDLGAEGYIGYNDPERIRRKREEMRARPWVVDEYFHAKQFLRRCDTTKTGRIWVEWVSELIRHKDSGISCGATLAAALKLGVPVRRKGHSSYLGVSIPSLRKLGMRW